MSSSTIGQRYAMALLAIGLERGTYEQLGRELDRVAQLFDIEDVKNLFRNPKFDLKVRKNVLTELLGEITVSPMCRNALFLLVDRNRIGQLPAIVDAYHALADAEAGRLRARVRVAQRLSESDVERLRSILENASGRKVLVEQEEDPSIIAGVITHMDGRIYDGSVSNQLQNLRARLKQGRAHQHG